MTDLHELYESVTHGMPYANRPVVLERPVVYVHPTAKVHQTTCLWHGARILADVVIGYNCNIGGGAEIGRGTTIGSCTRISSGVFLPPAARVGNSVFIGPNATFTDDRDPKVRRFGDGPYTAEPPIIEDHANIGAGAVVLPGVRIGHHALVGAGAIVTKDVPPHAVVRCEPARVTRTLEEVA